MTVNTTLRDFFFRLRYLFKGAPKRFLHYDVRLDESLRRWNADAEVTVQQVIADHLGEGQVFWDVGANFGLHSILGAKLVGESGRVLAAEPVPYNLRLLKRNIHLNKIGQIVRVLPSAIGATPSPEMEMTIEEGLSVAAHLGSAGPGTTIKVPVTTLDSLVTESERPPTFIKIDVEGAEHEVIKGAREMLLKHRPVLLIEVHRFALPDFGSSSEEFSELLLGLGYEEKVIEETDGKAGGYHHSLFIPK